MHQQGSRPRRRDVDHRVERGQEEQLSLGGASSASCAPNGIAPHRESTVMVR